METALPAPCPAGAGPDTALFSWQVEPFYCDQLRISPIEMSVSSRLDLGGGGDGGDGGEANAGGGSRGGGGGYWLAAFEHIPLVSNLLQSMVVLVKGIGANLANVSGVPFYFDEICVLHPLCTRSELGYKLAQQLAWQAAAQLGKLLGHSDVLGNPLGLVSTVGSGVAGFVKGVGIGVVTGDGDRIVDGSKQLVGSVVGGMAGIGARLTGGLYKMIQRIQSAQGRGGGPAAEAGGEEVLAGGGDLKDGLKQAGKGTIKTLRRGLTGLVSRPIAGAKDGGIVGLAQGAADGVFGLALLPVAATLEAGMLVLSSVEQAALGADANGPLPTMRPARSFFSHARLLPLANCMMSGLQLAVHAARGTAVERGRVHIQVRLTRHAVPCSAFHAAPSSNGRSRYTSRAPRRRGTRSAPPAAAGSGASSEAAPHQATHRVSSLRPTIPNAAGGTTLSRRSSCARSTRGCWCGSTLPGPTCT